MSKVRENKILNRKRIDTTEEVIETVESITNQEIRVSHIDFNYEILDIEENEKKQLVEIEKELQFHEKNLKKISLDIGKSLYDAREIFIRNHSESFMLWYGALGLSKDQVSHFINRYKLALDYPENKEMILKLTDKVIKEVTNKKTPPSILERVISGEQLPAAEIKRLRDNISNRDEIFSEIEEGSVSSQKTFENIAKALTNLRDKMNGYATNEEIKKLKRIEKLINEVRQ